MDDQSRIVLGEAGVSAALEPPRRRFFSRRRKEQPPPLPYCENCGAPMSGPFCAKCGQHAVDYRRSFGRVFADVLDSFLNWDSKFFATIGLLLARPWKLTIDFVAGKRVRYVHPLRLYLLVSIVFFFVVNHFAKSIHSSPTKISAAERSRVAAELDKEDMPPQVKERVRRALNTRTAVSEPDQTPADGSNSSSPAATPSSSASARSSPATGDFGPLVQFDKPPTDNIGK